ASALVEELADDLLGSSAHDLSHLTDSLTDRSGILSLSLHGALWVLTCGMSGRTVSVECTVDCIGGALYLSESWLGLTLSTAVVAAVDVVQEVQAGNFFDTAQ